MRGTDQRMTQLELSQLHRVEGFHFLFMQDLIIQNLDDWSDEDRSLEYSLGIHDPGDARRQ